MTKYEELLKLRDKDLGENQNEIFHEIVIDDVAICGLVDMGEDIVGLIGVYVHPDYRKQGYGDKLIQEVLKHSKDMVVLSTYFHMQPAIRLYQRHGFIITDYEDDHVYMMWRRNNGFEFNTRAAI